MASNLNKRELNLMCELPHAGHNDLMNTMPDDESFVEQALIFQQISDETRLKILFCLCHHEYCVYDLAQIVAMSAPAISHHLRSLKQMKIIRSRRSGKHVFYSLTDSEEAKQIYKIIMNTWKPEREGVEE